MNKYVSNFVDKSRKILENTGVLAEISEEKKKELQELHKRNLKELQKQIQLELDKME